MVYDREDPSNHHLKDRDVYDEMLKLILLAVVFAPIGLGGVTHTLVRSERRFGVLLVRTMMRSCSRMKTKERVLETRSNRTRPTSQESSGIDRLAVVVWYGRPSAGG